MVAREGGEEFLAEGRGFLAGHGFGFFLIVFRGTVGEEIESAGRDGEQGFSLEKMKKIAVEGGVDLQGVAAMLDDVRVNEAGDAALAEEGFAELPSESGGIGLR